MVTDMDKQRTPEGLESLLTAQDVARVLKVKPVTVYGWAKRGNLVCHRLMGCVRFSRADVRNFIQQSRRSK
ncbi:helix-turn-helix domain-containing protein [Thermodesulfobacteriota bacterium]